MLVAQLLKPKTIVAMLVAVWLLISAVLFERSHWIFWSDLVAGAAVLAGALVRTNARHARLVSWAMALTGVWLVISPWMLGDHSADPVAWSYIAGGFVLAVIEIAGLSKRAFRRMPRY
jgi:SPW repeat